MVAEARHTIVTLEQLQALGLGAVLSHRCAAALRALRPYSGALIDVTVPRRASRRRPGVRLPRSTTVIGADTSIVDGIPCTSVARAMFDLADVVNRRGVERAFDQSESLEVFDLTAIRDQLERNAGRREACGIVKLVLGER